MWLKPNSLQSVATLQGAARSYKGTPVCAGAWCSCLHLSRHLRLRLLDVLLNRRQITHPSRSFGLSVRHIHGLEIIDQQSFL